MRIKCGVINVNFIRHYQRWRGGEDLPDRNLFVKPVVVNILILDAYPITTRPFGLPPCGLSGLSGLSGSFPVFLQLSQSYNTIMKYGVYLLTADIAI
nr:MAG: hypothetical protein [Bacteriophage sp.]